MTWFVERIEEKGASASIPLASVEDGQGP